VVVHAAPADPRRGPSPQERSDAAGLAFLRPREAKEDADEVTHGALAGVFERMLFLTATPFQLGHAEL